MFDIDAVHIFHIVCLLADLHDQLFDPTKGLKVVPEGKGADSEATMLTVVELGEFRSRSQ